jgi:Excalibur calcium-binding domain/Protein of unknown function (DUF1524)
VRTRTRAVAASIALALLATVGAAMPAQAATKVSALTLLGQLKVLPEWNAGYDRARFTHWIDADHDGQDTRQEVLRGESRARMTFTSTSRVSTGRWYSAYDARTVTVAARLDIDHMVPLAEAWGAGAKGWNAATRRAYANDLGYGASLIAVTAASNRSKSAGDPSQWLPTNRAYRCTYVRNWVAVKWRWSLSVDKPERAKVVSVLKGCSSSARLVAKPAKAKVVKGATSAPAPTTNDPRFSYCYEAKAQGYGPYVLGRDPEYAWYGDRDGDGIVCE